MRSRPFPSVPLVLLSSLFCACAPPAASSPGEHEDPGTDHAPASQTVFGVRLLAHVEHPHLVRGEEAEFLVHLSVLATGAPVRTGRVTLELGSVPLTAEGPRREGLFVPLGTPAESGTLPARLVVESGADSETLALGPLRVHPSAEEAARAADEEPAGPPDAIPFLLEQQWKVSLMLAEAGPRTLTERLVVPAAVVTPEGARAAVAAPIAGRLLPPDGGGLPESGARVERGAVLGWIEPPLDGAARAFALELAATRLEIERSASAAAAALAFAAKDRARLAGLFEQGLATQQERDQAERELAAAEGAARAADGALAALARLGTGDGAGAPLRLALVAPLSGLVVSAPHVSGASLEAGAEVFQLLDPERLWIEGRVGEYDLARLGAAPAALAAFPALPGLTLALAAPEGLAPSLEPGSRTVGIRYATRDGSGKLRAGLLAELALALASVEAAVAIPRAAVVRERGIPTAYAMLAGETFQRRELELGVADGDWVEVRAGLRAGERVATRGAHLVRLAALAPESFGHGHAH